MSLSVPPPGLRCRKIGEGDLDEVAALLARGFPGRRLVYWRAALDRLRRRLVPDGYPRFGFMLECGGSPVGVLLLICQAVGHEGEPFVRCNVASWYVEPAFRSHAALLSAVPLRYRAATFLNTSPAPNTRAIIATQGFTRYTGGQLLGLPLLGRAAGPGLTLAPFDPADPGHAALDEAGLLADHRTSGCLSLVGREGGALRPFVLMPMRARQGRWRLPAAQLVFCRALDDVVRFARPLGRALLGRGLPLLVVDAEGPVAGLPGLFWRGRAPKYYRGDRPPRPGDLAYTEFPLFGA